MSYQPNENQNYYPPPPPPTPMNGKSIAGFVLGVLSIIVPYIGFLLGIVAVILSALSLKEIRIRYEQGRGLAIAGLVCGIVGTLFYAIFILFFVFLYTQQQVTPPTDLHTKKDLYSHPNGCRDPFFFPMNKIQ